MPINNVAVRDEKKAITPLATNLTGGLESEPISKNEVEGTMHRLPRPRGLFASQDRRQFRPGWVNAWNLKNVKSIQRGNVSCIPRLLKTNAFIFHNLSIPKPMLAT
jgi:hypothetical protein